MKILHLQGSLQPSRLLMAPMEVRSLHNILLLELAKADQLFIKASERIGALGKLANKIKETAKLRKYTNSETGESIMTAGLYAVPDHIKYTTKCLRNKKKNRANRKAAKKNRRR